MSVIVEFQIPSTDFELGRVLRVDGISSIELETLVPVGGDTVPLFWVYNSTRDSFVESINRHPVVANAAQVDEYDDRTLFTLDWDASQDHVFQAIKGNNGHLLSATGTASTWKFEVRFPYRTQLSSFSTECENAQITLDVHRIYSPEETETDPLCGLTRPQYDAIMLAMEWGYYDIPRRCTTKELADELGISDQAVMERLRRAISTVMQNTLRPADEGESPDDTAQTSDQAR